MGQKELVKCDRGEHVPRDRDPNIVAKWKSRKKCDLGDSAIHEKSSIVTILRRPSEPGDPGNAGEIRLETKNHHDRHVGFKAPVLDSSTVWTLPPADGTDGQRLITDGLGQLKWDDCCTGGHQPVVNGDLVCLRAGQMKFIDVVANDYVQNSLLSYFFHHFFYRCGNRHDAAVNNSNFVTDIRQLG